MDTRDALQCCLRKKRNLNDDFCSTRPNDVILKTRCFHVSSWSPGWNSGSGAGYWSELILVNQTKWLHINSPPLSQPGRHEGDPEETELQRLRYELLDHWWSAAAWWKRAMQMYNKQGLSWRRSFNHTGAIVQPPPCIIPAFKPLGLQDPTCSMAQRY